MKLKKSLDNIAINSAWLLPLIASVGCLAWSANYLYDTGVLAGMMGMGASHKFYEHLDRKYND